MLAREGAHPIGENRTAASQNLVLAQDQAPAGTVHT
jgi:hypothetical protein